VHLDRDLELDFIREFAVCGEMFGGLSADDRRERIRVAIFTHKLAHAPFRDTGMNYASAYQKCYGRPIEMRRTPRSAPQHVAVPSEEDDNE
jgi:hypothetical protein